MEELNQEKTPHDIQEQTKKDAVKTVSLEQYNFIQTIQNEVMPEVCEMIEHNLAVKEILDPIIEMNKGKKLSLQLMRKVYNQITKSKDFTFRFEEIGKISKKYQKLIPLFPKKENNVS